ncbi:MAG: hypothetical protein ACREJC_16115 [Tepidisphaeraceae bacterium]
MRKTWNRTVLIAMTCLAALAGLSCTQPKKEPAGADSRAPGTPAAFAVASIQMTATVTAIDQAKRTVTLRGADGVSTTYKVSKQAVNFDQMRVGDQVTATLVESIAAWVRRADMPPSAQETGMVALAPRGAKPGVVMADTFEMSATVLSVSAPDRAITLQGPDARTRTFKVGPNVDLTNVHNGDDVVIRVTEAIAVFVEKPAAK